VTITAKIGADGLAVHLRADDIVPAVLDQLADAYGNDPQTVGQLLLDLAAAREHLAGLTGDQNRRNVPEWMVSNAGHIADQFRDELAETAITEHLQADLGRREAMTLAAELTEAANKTLTARLTQGTAA
jgi:hypothetical protein